MVTLQEQLEIAETAYLQLITGKAPRVVVDQNGERVEFAAANATKLLQFIQRLKSEIAGTTSGPMRVIF